MAQCVTVATATQTNLVTETSTSTSISTSFSTIDAVTSTLTISEACTSTASNGSCAASTPVLSTTTIPASTSTITSDVVTTLFFTSTSFVTLSGTSCSNPPTSDNNNQPPPISDSSTTSTSSSQPPPDNGQTSPGITPPVQTPSDSASLPGTSSTQSNGAVVVVQTISGEVVTKTVGTVQSDSSAGGHSNSSSHLGAIIGGTVGGVVGLIAIVAVAWFFIKRRSRWDDIFDEDAAGGPRSAKRDRFSLAEDLEPKPYQYGLVGRHPSPQPGSPPLTAASGSETVPAGFALGAGQSLSYGPRHSEYSDGSHGRSNSLAPLNVPMNNVGYGGMGVGGPTPGVSPGPSTHSMSRPSTAGSMQPLNNVNVPTPGQGGLPPPLPPPGAGFGAYAAQQGQQQAFNPYAQQGQQNHSRGTSTNTYHSNSGSINGPPINPQNNWNAINNATPPHPQHSNTLPPVLPPVGGSSSLPYDSPEPVARRPSQESDSYFSGVLAAATSPAPPSPGRSGSPVSFRDQSMGALRIVNQNQRASTFSSVAPMSADPRSSVFSSDTILTAAGGSVVVVPERDGKGRMVKRNTDGSVVIHRDAGRIEEERGEGSGPAPPAYSL